MVALEHVSSATKKDTWQESVLIQVKITTEEIEEEVEVEAEEVTEITKVVVAMIDNLEHALNVRRKVTWQENAQMTMEMKDPTRDKEEITMMIETITEEKIMMTTGILLVKIGITQATTTTTMMVEEMNGTTPVVVLVDGRIQTLLLQMINSSSQLIKKTILNGVTHKEMMNPSGEESEDANG